MLKKILAALAAIGAFFSTIFFVLMKQAKTEQKLEVAENKLRDAERREEQTEVVRKAENAVHNSIAKQEAENEELVQRVCNGDNLDGFNAGLDLLRKQSERGNKRNTRTSKSGA